MGLLLLLRRRHDGERSGAEWLIMVTAAHLTVRNISTWLVRLMLLLLLLLLVWSPRDAHWARPYPCMLCMCSFAKRIHGFRIRGSGHDDRGIACIVLEHLITSENRGSEKKISEN